MQRTSKALSQQTAAKLPVPAQPKPLDARELAQVSGGLPRGGGWAACAPVPTLLPRGGGW